MRRKKRGRREKGKREKTEGKGEEESRLGGKGE